MIDEAKTVEHRLFDLIKENDVYIGEYRISKNDKIVITDALWLSGMIREMKERKDEDTPIPLPGSMCGND